MSNLSGVFLLLLFFWGGRGGAVLQIFLPQLFLIFFMRNRVFMIFKCSAEEARLKLVYKETRDSTILAANRLGANQAAVPLIFACFLSVNLTREWTSSFRCLYTPPRDTPPLPGPWTRQSGTLQYITIT